MDNIGIVVKDLKAAVEFFEELGLEAEGEMMTVEGRWVDRVVGLQGVKSDIAMLSTPDGHSRLELMRYQRPVAGPVELHAPVNALGIRRIMFTVSDIAEVTERLKQHGAELMGELARFEDVNQAGYLLAYLRGPEGIIVGLAEELGRKPAEAVQKSQLLRMDNVLVVVEDLEAVKSFFLELGFEFQGEASVGGPLVDKLIALKDVQATLVLMQTPDGHGRIELDKFHSPDPIRMEAEDAPPHSLGIRRIMLAVEDIDEAVGRLQAHGAKLIGEVVQYEDSYRLCYLRGPEGIMVALAQELRKQKVG